MLKPKTGIALGSGGARGWAHIGVLRELEARGVKPHCVAGTSMGALVGAAYVSGNLDKLEEWAVSLTPTKAALLVDLNLLGGGMVDAKPIMKWFESLDHKKLIEDQPIRYAAVATDMRNGQEVDILAGSLIDAMRASISLPGVVSPFFKDGRWLVDGGMTNPIPVSVCRDMGADFVIAVNPEGKENHVFWEQPKENETWVKVKETLSLPVRSVLATFNAKGPKNAPKAPNYFDVVAMAIDQMTDQIRAYRLEKDQPDAMLDVELGQFTILEFLRAEEAIAEGKNCVAQNWDMIEAMIGREVSR